MANPELPPLIETTTMFGPRGILSRVGRVHEIILICVPGSVEITVGELHKMFEPSLAVILTAKEDPGSVLKLLVTTFCARILRMVASAAISYIVGTNKGANFTVAMMVGSVMLPLLVTVATSGIPGVRMVESAHVIAVEVNVAAQGTLTPF